MTPQAMTVILNKYFVFRILKPSFFALLREGKGSKAARKKQLIFQSGYKCPPVCKKIAALSQKVMGLTPESDARPIF
jgi:hypothetical protein